MPGSAVCPEGWITAGNKCFKYDATLRKYEDSVSYCVSQGGQIASIHSDEENEAVIKLAKTDVYIGAESDLKGNWKWTDGTPWWQPTSEKHDGLVGLSESVIIIARADTKWHDWGTGDDKSGVVCARAQTKRCDKDSRATCKVVTDNLTDRIYVDGVLVPGSNSGAVITFDIPDCATSVTIYAKDFESGCVSGGTKIDCSGKSVRWGKVNGDQDRSNWRVHEKYITGAFSVSAASTSHLAWVTASASKGGHGVPGICGPGNQWTFRRDVPLGMLHVRVR